MPSGNPSSPPFLQLEEDDGEEEDSDYDSEEDAEDEEEDAEDEEEDEEQYEEEYIPLERRSARNPRPPSPNSPPLILIEEDDEDNRGEDEDGAVVEVEAGGSFDSGPEKPGSEADAGDAGRDEPDTFACSICMEPWTSVGPHRTWLAFH